MFQSGIKHIYNTDIHLCTTLYKAVFNSNQFVSINQGISDRKKL